MNKGHYALGYNVGQNLRDTHILELDNEAFLAGLQAGIQNQTPAFSIQELQQALNTLLTEHQSAQKQQQEDFLKQNGTRKEVTTTPSGLQYEVMESTIGRKPKATDEVKVHYEGSLIDGTVFDSSYKRGEPITFALDCVIAGWTEGVQLMSIGSKYKFYIPYHLAYGEQGIAGTIPPCATLIFVVELLDIIDKK